jgi:hypothetical protein
MRGKGQQEVGGNGKRQRGWKGTHLEGIQVGCRIKPRMGMERASLMIIARAAIVKP